MGLATFTQKSSMYNSTSWKCTVLHMNYQCEMQNGATLNLLFMINKLVGYDVGCNLALQR